MKQSLVFGGNGFLGNSLLQLNSVDVPIIGVSRKQSLNDQYINSDYSYSNVRDILKKIQPEVIFYSLGSSTVSTSYIESDLGTSVTHYETLLQVLCDMKLNSKVFYFSSSAVYGDQSEYFLNEKLLPNPTSPYGENKLKGELLTTKYVQNFALRGYNLRIFSTFGPNQKRYLIWDVFEKFKKGFDFTLEGDGEQVRDLLHSGDFADLVHKISALPGIPTDKPINVASGRNQKISEVVNAISKICSRHNAGRITPSFEFSRSETPGKPLNLASDITYLKDLLGSQVFSDFSFDSKLDECINEWFSN